MATGTLPEDREMAIAMEAACWGWISMPNPVSSTGGRRDLSFLAYIATMLCFGGLLLGGLAVQFHREDEMMRTMPATEATVLSLRPTRSGFAAAIAFTRIAHGTPVSCRDTIGLQRSDERAYVGALIHLIPRSDSCAEAVVVGPRKTSLLLMLCGAALLASFVSALVCAWSMKGTRRALQ